MTAGEAGEQPWLADLRTPGRVSIGLSSSCCGALFGLFFSLRVLRVIYVRGNISERVIEASYVSYERRTAANDDRTTTGRSAADAAWPAAPHACVERARYRSLFGLDFEVSDRSRRSERPGTRRPGRPVRPRVGARTKYAWFPMRYALNPTARAGPRARDAAKSAANGSQCWSNRTVGTRRRSHNRPP